MDMINPVLFNLRTSLQLDDVGKWRNPQWTEKSNCVKQWESTTFISDVCARNNVASWGITEESHWLERMVMIFLVTTS